MTDLIKELQEFLTSLGLPTPVVLGTVLLAISARSIFKFGNTERELRRKEIEGALAILEKNASESTKHIRELLVDQIEREEFRRSTGLTISSKSHRNTLYAFVKAHHDDLGWHTLKNATEFWEVRSDQVLIHRRRFTWLIYWIARLFGWICLAAASACVILTICELLILKSWGQARQLIILAIESFVIWLSVALSFSLPLVARAQIQRVISKRSPGALSKQSKTTSCVMPWTKSNDPGHRPPTDEQVTKVKSE